jgi:hypothetical protein
MKGGIFGFGEPSDENQTPVVNQTPVNQTPVNQTPDVNQTPGMFDSLKNTATSALETTKNEFSNQTGQLQAETAQLTGQIQSGLTAAKEEGSGFLDSINIFSSSPEEEEKVEVAPGSVEPKKEGMLSSFGFGGGRRRRSRQLKGGRTLDFGYDAASVTNANVAQPTYMMTSGGKRRRRTCKKRRKCCKKSCRKHHRHHYKR